MIQWGRSRIYTNPSLVGTYPVAIVFGAAIRQDGSPKHVLEDRLQTAAELYRRGAILKILVSGDNRVEDYNEPEGMYQYLTGTLGVPAQDIARDFGGRRTYDTCRRAHEVFGVRRALLITQGYHLPRALFLCNHLGIESDGISASRREYLRLPYFKLREILALYNALIDLYLWSPAYVGGQPLPDLHFVPSHSSSAAKEFETDV